MQITIHRGINQIGGCITEIATRTTKIFIDLGHNLPKGNQPAEDDKANHETIAKLTKGVQAIFYTHYHGDHVDLFKFVPDGVEQYIGETAKEIMQIKYARLARSPRFKKEVTPELLQKLESFHTFKATDRIQIGNIAVTPYYVSHSACDAYMFLIEETNGLCKRILHTGDFRGHGYTSKGLIPTLKSYILKKPINVLITEGTMLSRPDEQPMREQELQMKAAELMRQYKYVFVLCSSTDMERLASFHAASKTAKRSFLCDGYQEDVLKVFTSIAESSLFKFDNVYYYKHNHKAQFATIEQKGFCMLIRGKFTHDENALQDLLQQLPQEQTLLIYSYWDGYLNEGENQIADFAEIWDMFPNKLHLHTSGHASADCLAEVCRLVNPTTAIIPIHSQVSDDFKKLPLSDNLKGKIITESMLELGLHIKIKNPISASSHVSVNLTSKLRLKQALVKAGVTTPRAVVKLTVSGSMTEKDFEYIRKEMNVSLEEIDMTNATMKDNKIPEFALDFCMALTSVIIPDTVTEIGDTAFNFGNAMTSFMIPRSLTEYIHPYLFSDCREFNEFLVHPDNPVYASEDGVLFNKDKTELLICPPKKREHYIIPNTVVKIGQSAFACCEITTLTIPDSVKKIDRWAFDHSHIDLIRFPASIKKINNEMFMDSGIKSIIIDPKNKALSSEDGVVYNKDKSLLIYFPEAREDDYCIPASVCDVEENDIFSWNLKSITVHPDNPNYSSENGVLFNKDKTKLIKYPIAREGEYIIPDTVVTIKSFAFSCAGITSVIIPDSVVEIESKAFNHCRATAVFMPHSGIKIRKDAFYGCKAEITVHPDIRNKRCLASLDMTGVCLERGEGADTAAISICKTETTVAAVSAPSFSLHRAVIPNGTQWNEESHDFNCNSNMFPQKK